MQDEIDERVPATVVARRICEIGGWAVDNLKLQKLLYFAHMFYTDRNREGLVREPFEAWKYGPVVPEVYRLVNRHKGDVIPFDSELARIGSSELAVEDDRYLGRVWVHFGKYTGMELVEHTHDRSSAWRRVYRRGQSVLIPQKEIIDEFNRRVNDT